MVTESKTREKSDGMSKAGTRQFNASAVQERTILHAISYQFQKLYAVVLVAQVYTSQLEARETANVGKICSRRGNTS
jgi:hypothetical protein